jgi:hypothetical protein
MDVVLEMAAGPVLAVGGNSEPAEASPQFAAPCWFELVIAIRPGALAASSRASSLV